MYKDYEKHRTTTAKDENQRRAKNIALRQIGIAYCKMINIDVGTVNYNTLTMREALNNLNTILGRKKL